MIANTTLICIMLWKPYHDNFSRKLCKSNYPNQILLLLMSYTLMALLISAKLFMSEEDTCQKGKEIKVI